MTTDLRYAVRGVGNPDLKLNRSSSIWLRYGYEIGREQQRTIAEEGGERTAKEEDGRRGLG